VAFLKSRLFPANQSNWKSIQKALIGWKKAGPPKKPESLQDYHKKLLVMKLIIWSEQHLERNNCIYSNKPSHYFLHQRKAEYNTKRTSFQQVILLQKPSSTLLMLATVSFLWSRTAEHSLETELLNSRINSLMFRGSTLA